MKKKFFYILSLLVIATVFVRCEGFGNCRVCRLNTYEDGNVILSSSEAEYCDAELISIQTRQDVVDGSTVLRWECD